MLGTVAGNRLTQVTAAALLTLWAKLLGIAVVGNILAKLLVSVALQTHRALAIGSTVTTDGLATALACVAAISGVAVRCLNAVVWNGLAQVLAIALLATRAWLRRVAESTNRLTETLARVASRS